MNATLHFLGTSDSKGVPRFWCACPVCHEARTGGHNRRTRPSALLRGWNGETLLLDCGPDLHAQLARLGGPFVPDAVLVSHAHNDHLLGLGDLLDYVTYAGKHLKIYAPAPVLPEIEERFRYAFRHAPPVLPLPQAGLDVCGFRVQAFEVPHGANGTSHAFRFSSPQYRWAYMTDSIGVPPALADAWLQDLDLLVLGTSFHDESHAPLTGRSVYDVREALNLPWARSARRVILSHLSHDIDVRQPVPDPRFTYATDGRSVSLSSAAAPRTGRP
ncbi:MBL fold metallo-hydrolase [Deinococcus aquiradiocola]|uniref:MBL fold metallo-hydrolase n=1 Tax=Deinococcus aquiradiocola TaxID=393059 RepID=A0A917P7N2_9DEIO|nr:MBL fold metallo-hydrolase [Deinococcus aquiradiocola]GGJ65697.1 MBL fold metallo-hydrolase [Deinococcus aquiradiocola]